MCMVSRPPRSSDTSSAFLPLPAYGTYMSHQANPAVPAVIFICSYFKQPALTYGTEGECLSLHPLCLWLHYYPCPSYDHIQGICMSCHSIAVPYVHGRNGCMSSMTGTTCPPITADILSFDMLLQGM